MVEEKKIVLVSLFFNEEAGNVRINTIYNLLKENGKEVEVITADFNHQTKKKHDLMQDRNDITFLSVPKYKLNISFRRLYSHFIFAFRLFFYLKKFVSFPSKIYCQIPTISSGLVCSYYCKKKGIPFVVDVIDLWPESLIVLYSCKKFLQLITFPMKWLAEKVYNSADFLFTGSVQYAQYVQKYNKKAKAIPVYLGIDIQRYQFLISSSLLHVNKPQGQKWICFGGMLGNSYDFKIILEGFKKLSDEKKYDIKLIFIGDGQERKRIMQFKNIHVLDIEITGFLKYADYLKYLSYADIAINSFKKGTRVAYSYKFNDYIAAGIPVLNNVKGEMAEIITRYDIGRNFDYSVNSLYNRLKEMLDNPGLLPEMRKNAAFVATTVLDKKIVYREMVEKLMH